MVIYTGSYKYCKSSRSVSISNDGGKQIGFGGPIIKELAPKLSWWKEWHNNIGKIPEDENLVFYIKSYYETVLKCLEPAQIIRLIPSGAILTCYEEPEEFCHREIVAAYLELYYGTPVFEIKINSDGKIVKQRRNKYFNIIKDYLEELIKGDIEMYGYNSIAASYSYRCSLDLEKHPELCKKFPVTPEDYRSLAEIQEKEYLEKKHVKRVS